MNKLDLEGVGRWIRGSLGIPAGDTSKVIENIKTQTGIIMPVRKRESVLLMKTRRRKIIGKRGPAEYGEALWQLRDLN